MLEYNSTDNSNPNFIELNKELHLEHILPKEYKKYKDWNHITPEVASTWLNSLGNLTLLSGSKNIEASNNPFKVKIDIYKGKGKHDNKDEKVTAFRISQSIVDDYNSNTFKKMWNEKSMDARWSWVLDEVEEIFNIDCSKIR